VERTVAGGAVFLVTRHPAAGPPFSAPALRCSSPRAQGRRFSRRTGLRYGAGVIFDEGGGRKTAATTSREGEVGIDRRGFLKGTAAASALAATAPAFLRRALAAERFKLCTFFPLSGNFADTGRFSEMGAALAVRALAKEYGVDVDYIKLDAEGNPGNAVRKVKEQIQRDGVRFFTGGSLSSVGLAVSSEVNKAHGVYFTSVGADEVTGSECNKATFRWAVPTYGAIQETVRPLIEMFPKAKRWYTITPKYVFGDSLLHNAEALFKQKGIEHVGNSYHSLKETEFSGYLTNALAAQPDVLLLLNFGSQSTATLRQAVDFGLKQKMKILMVWAAGLEQYQAIGSDVLDGVYVGCQYWHQIDSPGNKKIMEIFKKDANRLPSYASVSGYICNQLMMEGVKRAGSTDPKAIIAALEGLKYEGPTGDEEIQAFDHQCVKNYYLLRGKPADKKKYKDDYVEIVSSGKSFIPKAQTACKMA
jgi:branched-chain amino acid transport system substrate-binding protein